LFRPARTVFPGLLLNVKYR